MKQLTDTSLRSGTLKSGTERVCIMNVRLVCVFASSTCIGAEPAAYVEENVESRKCDFRAVILRMAMVLDGFCVVALSEHTYVTGMTEGFQNCAQIRFKIRNESLRYE